MSVVAILNPKGGSGKSTLSTNLAGALHYRGNSTLLVDSDPQGSARDWHGASEDNPIPLVALDRPSTLSGLPTIAAPYDYTLIDGESKVEAMLAAAIKVSDVVLIPVAPSPYDIWACSDLVDMIKTRQSLSDDGQPKAAFVISRARKRTKLGAEVLEALHDYDLPIFDRQVMQREIYPQTESEGLTVVESGNLEAATEMQELANELLEFIASPVEVSC